jgi:hypothetical protein
MNQSWHKGEIRRFSCQKNARHFPFLPDGSYVIAVLWESRCLFAHLPVICRTFAVIREDSFF